MNLLNELKRRGFVFNASTPLVHCKVLEDNKSCIEIVTNHRTRPRTKHLSVRLHHFRSHIVAKTISIQHVSTHEQMADTFTKPLPRNQFIKLTNKLMGWTLSSPAREGEIFGLRSRVQSGTRCRYSVIYSNEDLRSPFEKPSSRLFVAHI